MPHVTRLAAAGAVMLMVGCSAPSQPPQPRTRISVADATADVVVAGPGDTSVTDAPDNTTADIVTTTIDHAVDEVTFEVAFADLEPGQYLDVTAWLTTDAADSRSQLTALAHQGRHQVDLHAADASSTCEAATVDVDYTGDTLTMSVPRSCLDDPRWVEAEVVASTMDYDAAPGDPRADLVWQDDAFQEGFSQLRGEAGPRLHRP